MTQEEAQTLQIGDKVVLTPDKIMLLQYFKNIFPFRKLGLEDPFSIESISYVNKDSAGDVRSFCLSPHWSEDTPQSKWWVGISECSIYNSQDTEIIL